MLSSNTAEHVSSSTDCDGIHYFQGVACIQCKKRAETRKKNCELRGGNNIGLLNKHRRQDLVCIADTLG